MKGRLLAVYIAVTVTVLPACQRSPFHTAQFSPYGNVPQQVVQQQAVPAQVQDLHRRLADMDENNRELHTKLANSDREVQGMRAELTMLRDRLTQTVTQLQDERLARQDAENRVSAMQASIPKHLSATLKPNNSMSAVLQMVQLNIPGVEMRQDGDVIRVSLPADKMFPTNSTTLHQGSHVMLRQLAVTLAQHYPRQRIGIEGHIDATPGVSAASSHQIAAAQAMSVFQFLTATGIPPQQLSATSHGENHPIASNASQAGRAKNRRVDVVVYPETY